MLIYKFSLSVNGNDFYPKGEELPVSPSLQTCCIINPDDLTKSGGDSRYGYGSIMYMHKSILATKETILEYEKDFISFLEKHNKWFKDLGVTEYDIFTEVYYSGSQCNFEILGKDSLDRLRKLEMTFSFPVSIYKLKKEEIKALLLSDKPARY